MPRFFKILMYLFSAFILLAIVTVLLVIVFVDPNAYKSQLAEMVKAKTGRTLTIEGDIKLSFFPSFGLDLGKVSLGNAAGFQDPVFAGIEKAQVRVKLLPLLQKQLETDTILLEGVTLSLTQKADGHNNWQDLLTIAKQPKTTTNNQELTIKEFNINGLEVSHANITLDNQLVGTRYTLSNVALKTAAVALNQAIPITLNANLQTSGVLVLNGQLDVKTQLTLNPTLGLYDLTPLQLTAKLNGSVLGAQTVVLNMPITLDLSKQLLTFAKLNLQVGDNQLDVPTLQVDLAKQTLNLDALTMQALGMNLQVKLDAKQLFTFPLINGELTVSPFNPQIVLKQLGQATLQLPAPLTMTQASLHTAFNATPLEIALTGLNITVDEQKLTSKQVKVNLSKKTAIIEELALAILGMQFSGHLQAEKLFTPQAIVSGKLNLAEFNPRDLLKRLNYSVPVTNDPTALTIMALETQIQGELSTPRLENLKLRVDNSVLQGNVTVQNIKQPALTFSLTLDDLDLDRYLSPKKTEENKPATTSFVLPIDKLRALNLNGSLKVAKLKAANLKMTDVNLAISAQQGEIKISPATAHLYQGTQTGNFTLDTRSTPPKLSINEALNDIHMESLLTDLTGTAKITGLANVTAQVTADVTTAETLKNTLLGTVTLTLQDGAIKGFNLSRIIRKTKAFLRNQPVSNENEVLQTDFSSLQGTLQIKEYKIYNDDLDIKSPLLRVEGRGEIALDTQLINYDLKTAIVETSKGQGGQDLEELRGLTIPIRVSGTLTAPTIRPDLEVFKAILLEQAKNAAAVQLNTVISKEQDQLNQKVGKELGEKLGSVLQELNPKDLLNKLFK